MKGKNPIPLILALLAVWYLLGGQLPWVPGPGPGPGPSPNKATACVYVYEKDATAVPSAVLGALDKINREKKILATAFEEDTVDGSGQTPDQYKVPLEAARKAGLPSLVVMAGESVVKVVQNPTGQQVLEAVP